MPLPALAWLGINAAVGVGSYYLPYLWESDEPSEEEQAAAAATDAAAEQLNQTARETQLLIDSGMTAEQAAAAQQRASAVQSQRAVDGTEAAFNMAANAMDAVMPGIGGNALREAAQLNAIQQRAALEAQNGAAHRQAVSFDGNITDVFSAAVIDQGIDESYSSAEVSSVQSSLEQLKALNLPNTSGCEINLGSFGADGLKGPLTNESIIAAKSMLCLNDRSANITPEFLAALDEHLETAAQASAEARMDEIFGSNPLAPAGSSNRTAEAAPEPANTWQPGQGPIMRN